MGHMKLRTWFMYFYSNATNCQGIKTCGLVVSYMGKYIVSKVAKHYERSGHSYICTCTWSAAIFFLVMLNHSM